MSSLGALLGPLLAPLSTLGAPLDTSIALLCPSSARSGALFPATLTTLGARLAARGSTRLSCGAAFLTRSPSRGAPFLALLAALGPALFTLGPTGATTSLSLGASTLPMRAPFRTSSAASLGPLTSPQPALATTHGPPFAAQSSLAGARLFALGAPSTASSSSGGPTPTTLGPPYVACGLNQLEGGVHVFLGQGVRVHIGV